MDDHQADRTWFVVLDGRKGRPFERTRTAQSHG
jgi:hypothetical protein